VAFYVFAGIATVAAALFVFFMPEPRPGASAKGPSEMGQVQLAGV
jgi:hypothetical protein